VTNLDLKSGCLECFDIFLDTPPSYGKISPHAEIAQLVEHATENCGVDSSILSLGTPAAQTPLSGCFDFLLRSLTWGKILSIKL
jgi:hypothetical protein